MNRLVTRLAGAALRLPAARTRRVAVTRDIPVRVRDGIPLRTDHYAPDLPGAPAVLVRTPYGRGGPMRLLGRLLAERGFHVVIQSCRGTYGSGGEYAPLVHERNDGLDTLDWLRRQPWWTGAFGMFGARRTPTTGGCGASTTGSPRYAPRWRWSADGRTSSCRPRSRTTPGSGRPVPGPGSPSAPGPTAAPGCSSPRCARVSTGSTSTSPAVRPPPGPGAGARRRGGWRDLADWPPPAVPTRWHLRAGRGLDPAPPAGSRPDRIWYDPADPTPSLGGPLLVAQRAGAVDNRPVEARPDVLTYTSAPLDAPVEVIGPVHAEIHLRSELSHLDVFVRLCDVDRRGRSWNVCDGLVRVTPGRFVADPAGVVRVPVTIWPTAHRFAPGHRLRIQISGGAHPRYARNPGTGEPLGTAITLRAGLREVLHDPAHPSAIVLPVAPPPSTVAA